MRTSPTTLPLVRGRVDTIIDRLDTLYYGSRNPTFQEHRRRLDGIRSALSTCAADVPTPLATEMVTQLDSLKRDLPLAYNAVLARGLSSADFVQDWSNAFPEICQYITFIANRVSEISSLPPPPVAQEPARATPAAAVAHHRQPSVTAAAMGLSRTASQPVVMSRSQAQPPPSIPHPDYRRSASSRTMGHAAPAPAPVSRIPLTGHYSMPQLGVPQTYMTYTTAGPIAVRRSPGETYPAAPVPPHLAHLYARSPVLGARY